MNKECLIKLSILDVAKEFDFSDELIQLCINESLYSFYDLVRYYLQHQEKFLALAPINERIALYNLIDNFVQTLSEQDTLEFRSDCADYGICGENDYLKANVDDDDKILFGANGINQIKQLLTTSLQKIAKESTLGDAAINACKSLSLNSLYDIIRHYLLGQDFHFHIKRSAAEMSDLVTKTLDNLDDSDIRIIKEYPSGNMKLHRNVHTIGDDYAVNWDDFVSVAKLKEITLSQLFDRGIIRIRTLHICTKSEMYTLYDIVRFYLLGRDFGRIQGSGATTADELNKIVKAKIKNLTEAEKANIIDGTEEVPSHKTHTDVSAHPDASLQEFYDIQLEKFSTRTRNVLKRIPADVFVNDYLYADDEFLRSLPCAGAKTIVELKQFQSILASYLGHSEPESVDNTIPATLLRFPKLINSSYVVSYYHRTGHLPMAWILEHELLSSDDNRSYYYLFSRGYYSKKKNLVEALHKHGIRNQKLLDYIGRFRTATTLNNNAKFPTNICTSSAWEYVRTILSKEPIINENDSPLKVVCADEDCSFSSGVVFDFTIHAFDCDLCKFLFSIGKRNAYQQRNIFWIRNSLQQIFDFSAFFESFIPRISRNEFPRIINVREMIHVSSCWADFRYSNFENVVKSVYTILQDEFSLSPNEHGYLSIPSRYGNDVSSILYAIIKRNGEPMHIDDIFNEFRAYFPFHKYQTSAQIRPALAKDNRITYRNRNSTFMLTDWGGVIRSGTIRDAIIEYLSSSETPQNLAAITDYVLAFFPNTNEKSIRNTMLADGQKRFCLYSGGLVGLCNKQYPEEYVPRTSINNTGSFEERLTEFINFIEEFERFPSPRNRFNGESAMYAWWARCVKNEIKLTEEQRQKVLEVKQRYANVGRLKLWHDSLTAITEFIRTNHRMPHAKGEESRLYAWLRTNMRKFESGELSLDEDSAKEFIELLDLVNEIND